MSSPKTPAFPQALDPRFRSPARTGIVSRLPLPPPLDGKTPRPRVAVGTDVPIEADRVDRHRAAGRDGRGGRLARETVPDAPAARAARVANAGPVAVGRNQAPARAVRRPPSLWSLVGAALLGFGVAFAAVYAVRHAAALGPSAVTEAVIRGAQPAVDRHDEARAGAESRPFRAAAAARPATSQATGTDESSVATATKAAGGDETRKDAEVTARRLEAPDAEGDAAAARRAAADDADEANEADAADVADAADEPAVADADTIDDEAGPDDAGPDDAGAASDDVAAVADEPEEAAAPRRRERTSGKRRRRARAAAAASDRRRQAEPSSASGEPAYLTIDAAPYATIYVDGERLGDTPLVGVTIRSGKRRVRAVSASGASKTFSIDIEPGDTFRRRMTFD